MRVTVDRLRLNLTGAAGHEHRVRPITRRALEQLCVRLRDDLRFLSGGPGDLLLERLTVPPLTADLDTLSDEAAAERVSVAVYTAIRAHWLRENGVARHGPARPTPVSTTGVVVRVKELAAGR